MLTHTQDNILTHFYMSLLVAIQQRKWENLPNVRLLNPHWFEPHSSFNSDDFSISRRIFGERSFVIQPKLAKWLNEKIQNDKKLNEKKPSIKTATPTRNGNTRSNNAARWTFISQFSNFVSLSKSICLFDFYRCVFSIRLFCAWLVVKRFLAKCCWQGKKVYGNKIIRIRTLLLGKWWKHWMTGRWLSISSYDDARQ